MAKLCYDWHVFHIESFKRRLENVQKKEGE